MLPKCESAEQVAALAPLEVVLIVETPLGALKVDETAAAANTVGVMWGAEDLFGFLGGTANRFADDSYRDVAKYVRSRSLLAAKAYGKQALDSVYIDIKNLDGLRVEVDDAVAVGFDIKVAIHPSQVAVIRTGYAPSADQVEWARHVLAAAADATGCLRFRGHNGGCASATASGANSSARALTRAPADTRHKRGCSAGPALELTYRSDGETCRTAT